MACRMKKYEDQALAGFEETGMKILEENERQLVKWGIQKVTAFEWMTYLAEETGELAQALNEFIYRKGKIEDVEKEAIQVATLACKMAEMFRKKDGRQMLLSGLCRIRPMRHLKTKKSSTKSCGRSGIRSRKT